MDYHYRYGDEVYTVQIEPQPDGTLRANIGGQSYEVAVQRSRQGQLNLMIDGERLHFYADNCTLCQTGINLRYVAVVNRRAAIYELEKVSASTRRSTSSASSGELKAQMPGQIMEVLVKDGDRVAENQTLLIMEAMKMELRVTAPFDGVISQMHATAGETVDRGQMLAVVTADGGST